MDADLLEAIRKSQVADALPEDQDPDEFYTTPDSGDQEPVDQQPAYNPNAQSLADYPSQPVAAATRDITPGVAPPESEYAGVAEDQAPKVVQPGAVPSPLPEVLQPEYAGISSDQEGGAAPDIVPQVERGQLVKLPPTQPVSAASAEVTPGVAPPVTEPAPDTLTQVERATPVRLPPPQPVAQASRELALRAQLMKLPPVQPVAQATRELGIAPRAQPVVQPAPDQLTQVERGQLVDSDSDQAQLELASLYGQGVRGTNVPQGTIAQVPQGQARTRLNPNDQSLDDYSKPPTQPVTPATAAQPPVTGDLAQGPPGTQPAGTRDEPYWPKRPEQISQLPPGSVYIDPRDGSVKTTPGKALGPQQPAAQQGGETGVANFYRKRGDKPITSGDDPRLTTVNVGDQKWQVNKEAAPYFQGFLNELAAKGAPIKALYPNAGWAYRKIAGTDTVSEHAYGGAIDVNQTLTGRNQVTAEFQKWMAANPGALAAAEKKWNIYGGERFGDLGHFEWGGVPFKQAAQQPGGAPITARALPAGAAPPIQPAQPVTTNPDGSDFPQRVQAVGNNDPAAFITHHTSGRGTVQGVIDTLNQRGLGVQYVMDRDGNIFQTGGPGAQNILTGWGPKGTGLSNQNIVGMEIIAKDDKDVTEAQKQSFARFMAARYPNTPIFGHGEVNPGHKEADEGQSVKAAALAYRDQVASGTAGEGAVARAEPATKGQNGLYANEKPEEFLTGRASVFATDDDIRSGQDNGVGSPKLGSINTNEAAAVAVPREALTQAFGNNPAVWRRARVDVVDTTTGKRLRLPIADLGPRGDLSAVIDQTPWVANYFGGDKTLSVKLVPNAGPDVMRNPQLFADEQAAIKQGIDSSSLQAGVQKIQGNLNYTLVSPDSEAHAKVMAADAANQAKQRQVIAQLPEVQKGDVMGAYNRLNNPIPGVSDAMRADAQKNLKAEAIAAMQARFPELRKSDAEAWAQAQSPVGAAMAFPAEVGKQIFANYGKLDVAFNQMMQGADSNRMTQFAKILHPDYTPEGLAAFVKSLTDIRDPAARSQRIGKLWAGLDPQVQASFDVNGLVTAADNLSNPVYQKAQNEAIETKRKFLDNVAAPDPRLKGTTAEWWAQTIGAIPANVSMAFLPPGAMETAFAAQIYADTKDKVKAAHPDWSDAQVAEMTKNSTLAQLLPQEVLSAISAGTLGPLVERLSGGKLSLDAISGAIKGIDNPALRAVTMAGTHVAAGAGLGVAQQISANVAEGRPAMEGVPQAVAGGAVIGAPGGIIHGVGALRRPEEAAVMPEAQDRAAAAQRKGLIVDVLKKVRDDPSYQPTPQERALLEEWNGREDKDDLFYSASANTADNRESEHPRMQAALDRILKPEPPPVRPPVEPPVSAVPVTQEDVARRAYELYEQRTQNGQPGTALDDWNQAHAELSHATEPILPGTMSEAEPITSAIANRYVQERMAAGELGQIDPSQGTSTEDMVQQGLQMSRAQRDGLIDNFMKAKGGDLDQQGAAIRSKEALLSEQARAASRAADADPTNPQLQAQAKAAADAVTAFHNGPIKKFKQVWSNSGRGLQREIPLDYTTFNGMKEAYLKGNNKEAPAKLEPKLKQMADAASKSADDGRVTMNNWGKEIGNQTGGKTLPNDDHIRTRLMEIMKHLPCPT